MKKNILLIIIITLLLLTGCVDKTELNKQLIEEQNIEIEKIEGAINQLNKEKDRLENDIESIKVEKNLARYFITINIKQSHFTLDIEKHIKDAMNEINIQIPVDREFYNSVDIGTVLDDSFREGSFWMEGSIGSWDIRVVDKEIQ